MPSSSMHSVKKEEFVTLASCQLFDYIGCSIPFTLNDRLRTVGYATLDWLLDTINIAILAISQTSCYNFCHKNAS
jgi:hypothetical protein